MRFTNRIVKEKNKRHNTNDEILFGSARQQRQHIHVPRLRPHHLPLEMVCSGSSTATSLSLKLAFLPQVISRIGDIGDCHSPFLEKRPAGKTCSSNCYCFKPFVEHYYQFVFTKSVRCLYY